MLKETDCILFGIIFTRPDKLCNKGDLNLGDQENQENQENLGNLENQGNVYNLRFVPRLVPRFFRLVPRFVPFIFIRSMF